MRFKEWKSHIHIAYSSVHLCLHRSLYAFPEFKLIWLSILFPVYDGRGTLEEGETAEARFIKIQAAYELLLDVEKRGQYDRDNRVNPLKVSFVVQVLVALYFLVSYIKIAFNFSTCRKMFMVVL